MSAPAEAALAAFVSNLPPLITKDQALEWAGLAGVKLKRATLDRRRASGLIKSTRSGGRVLIAKTEMRRYLNGLIRAAGGRA